WRMRQVERSAYVWQLDELIQSGEFREFPDKELIAVLVPEKKITSIRKQKIRRKFKGKDGEEYYREYLREYEAVSIYKRGEALHIISRKGNEGEKEEWKKLSEEELRQKSIIQRNGKFWVLVVMKIEEGLRAGARQRIRHIPASLVERRGRRFVIAGDARKLAGYAERIEETIRPLLKATPPSPEFLEKASDGFLQTWSLSERGRTWLMKKAREEMMLARQGKFWQMASHGGAALEALLEERARKYEMTVKSYNLGVKWAALDEETSQKFRYAYDGLGRLGMRLDQFEMRGETPRPDDTITKEAIGIYHYLIKAEGSHFGPYCERVWSDEFQALKEVPELAQEGKWWPTISNIIRNATAKLEVLAKGERISEAEIRRLRGMFSRGVAPV
ncbi:hypothetical protein KKA69_06770, partial [Patescibacteria group bacterium]|nr:hypothetical protein [Patescibacteria group bacterium]